MVPVCIKSEANSASPQRGCLPSTGLKLPNQMDCGTSYKQRAARCSKQKDRLNGVLNHLSPNCQALEWAILKHAIAE